MGALQLCNVQHYLWSFPPKKQHPSEVSEKTTITSPSPLKKKKQKKMKNHDGSLLNSSPYL